MRGCRSGGWWELRLLLHCELTELILGHLVTLGRGLQLQLSHPDLKFCFGQFLVSLLSLQVFGFALFALLFVQLLLTFPCCSLALFADLTYVILVLLAEGFQFTLVLLAPLLSLVSDLLHLALR